ncbi:MAG: hypothetical protein R2860_11390 [Desulfobacterales bacterium]
MSDALPDMTAHVAGDDIRKIKYGTPIPFSDIPPTAGITGAGFIKVIDAANRLLAVVSPDETRGRYNYCCVFYNP